MITISYLNVLLALLLLAVPGYMLFAYDRKSVGKGAVSVARMLVQLCAMGGLLWLLYRYDSVWLNLAWLLLLVVAAAFLMVSRTRLRSVVLFLPACVAMFVSVLTVSAYVLYGVLGVSSPWSARWFVPVTGVFMAHVVTTNIHAVRTYFDSLRQDSQPYLTLLGNGAGRLQALTPYFSRALKSLTVPMFANLSVMGLFVMPMLLSGLLLGGVSPVSSVFVFVAMILASCMVSVLSLILTLWLSDRRAFTRQGPLADIFTAA
jgi:putative ABC transport system permease protein